MVCILSVKNKILILNINNDKLIFDIHNGSQMLFLLRKFKKYYWFQNACKKCIADKENVYSVLTLLFCKQHVNFSCTNR